LLTIRCDNGDKKRNVYPLEASHLYDPLNFFRRHPHIRLRGCRREV